MSTWRLAKSLGVLRDQVNSLAPSRDKSSDGTIGDARHAASKSEHNPDSNGVVRAMDITNDPANGVISRAMVEALVASRDPRILYVISNKQICSSEKSPWTWRPYSGVNAHEHHAHISVVASPSLYDDTRPWSITAEQLSGQKIAQPPATLPPVSTLPEPAPASGSIEDRIRELLLDMSDAVSSSKTHSFALFKSSLIADVDALRAKIVAFDLGKPPPAPKPQEPKPAQPQPGTRRFSGIVTTVFGGSGDTNASAYGGMVDPNVPGVALPSRLTGKRPQVRVINPASGRSVICQIVDVGPWNTDDAYWLTQGGRPQAETGVDKSGRKTNLAGLDMTPAGWDALGVPAGKTKFDWEFVGVTVISQEKGKAMEESPKSVIVDVKPATTSKINITEVTAVIAHGVALWVGQKFGLDATMQGLVQMGVQAVFSTAVVIMRTWFTTTILKQSAPKA